jgi:hypothetical protein
MATESAVTASGGSRHRPLVLAVAAAALLAVAVLVVWLLLLGGSRSGPVRSPTPAAVAAPTTALVGPATTPSPPDRPVDSAKDPFRPLVAAGGTDTAATGTATSLGSGSIATGVVPSTPTTVPGSGGGAATAPGGGSSAAEQKVTLLDVFTRSRIRYVKVAVDDSPYTAKEGQSFASSYRVVDIGTSCAQFESRSTPFTLCEGEAVLK